MDAGRSAEKRYFNTAVYLPRGQIHKQTVLATLTIWSCAPKVNQRNVPGIDNAYLAMDTEEGVEVVWNEVMFSERKNFKLQEVGTVRGQSDSRYIHKLLKSPCVCLIS